jgi:hypothetical protein
MAVKAKRVKKVKIEIPDEMDLLTRVSQYDSDMARFKDFQALFFGTETGKKVIREILGMGYMLNDNVKYNKYGVDTNATLISTGERKLALAIHRIATVEPKVSPPRKQVTRR